MSVGKTTLVNALKELSEFKDYTFATERSKYLRDLGIPLNTDSTIKGQMVFLAERASELMYENIVTDRTVIDVMAFTRAAKSIPYFVSDQFEELALNLIKEYNYIFYVSPKGVDIEDNGVRTIDPKYRMEIDGNIRRLLDKYPHKFTRLHYISGTTEERIQQIKQVINFQYL